MPKIIPNIKEKILSTAATMLEEQGYGNFSIRKLASACEVAVGTIYNYFDGLDAIAAELIVSEWNRVLGKMDRVSEETKVFSEGMEQYCELFTEFINQFRPLWNQYNNKNTIHSYSGKYHKNLMFQLEEKIEKLLVNCKKSELLKLKTVLAEAMLACLMNREDGTYQMKLLASALVS